MNLAASGPSVSATFMANEAMTGQIDEGHSQLHERFGLFAAETGVEGEEERKTDLPHQTECPCLGVIPAGDGVPSSDGGEFSLFWISEIEAGLADSKNAAASALLIETETSGEPALSNSSSFPRPAEIGLETQAPKSKNVGRLLGNGDALNTRAGETAPGLAALGTLVKNAIPKSHSVLMTASGGEFLMGPTAVEPAPSAPVGKGVSVPLDNPIPLAEKATRPNGTEQTDAARRILSHTSVNPSPPDLEAIIGRPRTETIAASVETLVTAAENRHATNPPVPDPVAVELAADAVSSDGIERALDTKLPQNHLPLGDALSPLALPPTPRAVPPGGPTLTGTRLKPVPLSAQASENTLPGGRQVAMDLPDAVLETDTPSREQSTKGNKPAEIAFKGDIRAGTNNTVPGLSAQNPQLEKSQSRTSEAVSDAVVHNLRRSVDAPVDRRGAGPASDETILRTENTQAKPVLSAVSPGSSALNSQLVPGTSLHPKQPVTTAAAQLDSVASNPPAETGQPAREVSVRLQNGEHGSANVLFRDRAGQVQVTVRAADPSLVHSLRSQLDSLRSGLELQGLDARLWNPASNVSAQSESPGNSMNTSRDADYGRDARQRGHSDDAGRQRRDQEQWASEPDKEGRWM